MARVEAGRLPRALRLPPIWRFARRNSVAPLSLLGGIALWEVLGHVLSYPWLPPLTRVVGALAELVESGVVLGNLGRSLTALTIGFSFSLVVGLTVGALMARYRKVEYALDIYVNAMLFAPSIVFAPIFFSIFGLSDITRVAVIVLYCMFIMIINTFTGFRSVDPALLEMAQSFGAKEGQFFFKILLPASLPVVFAGIRLGMGRAVKGMINGEMFIAMVGLGALAQKYGSQFDASKVLALVLVILTVAMAAAWSVQALDRRLTRWTE